MLVTRLRDAFSARVRPQAAGVARVAVGAAAILKTVERAPILERLSDPAVLHVPYFAGQPSVSSVPSELVLAAWVLLATAFMLGLATRLSGSALAILLTAVLLSDQQLYSNHLYLLILLVGLLTMADSGSSLSLDAVRGGTRQVIPVWPLTLIRLQVSIVYLFAGLSKVNAGYLSGSVIAVSLRDEGLLAIPAEWRTFELMAAAALVSIMVELGLSIGLWLPRWRRTAFLAGLGLHVGIAVWLDPTLPLIVFAFIALSPYVLFLDPNPRRLTIVYDDSCGFCLHWVRWFRRLDWLGSLTTVPSSNGAALDRLCVTRDEADQALQLIRRNRRSEGFRAVVGVLEALPISFLWAPILRLWPISQLGDAVYRRIALRRHCTINSLVR